MTRHVIIGVGVNGMDAAARLAGAGRSMTLLDADDRARRVHRQRLDVGSG